MKPPSIASSTAEERLAFVRERYQCISNCDLCGMCALFHGRDAQTALVDYIEGRQELREVLMRFRYRR